MPQHLNPGRQRALALGLAVSLLAAACSDDNDTAATSTDDRSSTTPPAESTTAPTTASNDGPGNTPATSAPSSAPATQQPTTPAPTTEAAAATFPRTVTHGLGETEIPAKPERIVPVVSEILGEKLIALGVMPVAALPPISALPEGNTYGLEALADVEPIGEGFSPNLELIAATQPDLIIADTVLLAAQYDELSAIAPTIAYDIFVDDWEPTFLEIAAAIGEEQAANAVIDDYQARIQAIASDVQATFGDEPVAIVQGNLGAEQGAAGTVRIYGTDTNVGRFMADLGITVWEPADPGGSEIAPSTFEVSQETVPDIDASSIIYLNEDLFVAPADIAGDPLWQATPAAQAGRLVFLDNGAQARLGGPIHKFIALDAMTDLLS
ncbi:MAG: iron-siderophore ABC transporter substrate-binding protein [Actinomycetota bacterium]